MTEQELKIKIQLLLDSYKFATYDVLFKVELSQRIRRLVKQSGLDLDSTVVFKDDDKGEFKSMWVGNWAVYMRSNRGAWVN